MTGSEALKAILQHKKVRRSSWKPFCKIGAQTLDGTTWDFCHIGFQDKYNVRPADNKFRAMILDELTQNDWEVVQ